MRKYTLKANTATGRGRAILPCMLAVLFLMAGTIPVLGAAEFFVLGINLNGDPAVVEGNQWLSQEEAENNGFSVTAGSTFNASMEWRPETDEDTAVMLDSVVYQSQGGFWMRQSLANGNYLVYFWLTENYLDQARSIDLKLEGAVAAKGIGKLKKGEWKKYGPYPATVKDGVLDIEFLRLSGDPQCSGLAIFATDAATARATIPPAPAQPSPTPKASQASTTSQPVAGGDAATAPSRPANYPSIPAAMKNRLIVLTDIGSDPDDTQSLVRTLLYSNEIDVEGLIHASGCWMRQAGSEGLGRILKVVEAYGKTRPNLLVHDKAYPEESRLRSLVKLGQTTYGMKGVGKGMETDGSRLIIAAVDKDDPRPVWITAWGGVSTLAQALWTVRDTRTPEQLARFVQKIRVYDIGAQDDAGAWITRTFPELFYLCSLGQFYGMGTQGNMEFCNKSWLTRNVQRQHGPLGQEYPNVAWTMEGDSPSFIHLINNGLHDPMKIDQGGWGGRFSTRKTLNPRSSQDSGKVARDQEAQDDYYQFTEETDDNNPQKPIFRWREAYQNDFAARMDWSVSASWKDANHNPVAVVNKDATREILYLKAAAGTTLTLDAGGSTDPDGNTLAYDWWNYTDPGTWQDEVDILNGQTSKAGIVIPADAKGETIHIILEIRDNGSPNLFAYRRVVIEVQ